MLDSKQWSGDIQLAQKDIKALQNTTKNAGDFMSNFGGTLASTAAKFAGWAGAGLAAKEGLDKFLRSGQQTGDWLEKNVNIWKGLFDGFFIALNNGSVDGFLNNMSKIADAVAEATAAMDDFNDAKLSMDVWEASFAVKQAQILNKIKLNKNNPEELKKLQQELRNLETERKTKLGNVQMMKEDAIIAAIKSQIVEPLKTGQNGIKAELASYIMARTQQPSIESLQKIMSLETADVFGEASKKAEAIAQVLSWHVSQAYQGKATLNGQFALTHGTRVYGEAEQYTPEFIALMTKLMNAFQKTYGVDFMQVLKWNSMADTKEEADVNREFYRTQISEWYALLQKDVDFERKNIRGLLQGEGGGSGKKSKDVEPYLEGSIGALEQQIKVLKDKFARATTAVERAAIASEIAAAEIEKKGKEVFVTVTPIKGDMTLGGESVMKSLPMASAPAEIGKRMPDANVMEKVFPEDGENKWLDNTIEGMGALSSAMSSLSGITDEGTAAWLQWGAKALDSLRAVFQAMISTGLVSSATSAAQSGPLGWLSMGVAVAQAIAVFASIPKFAAGGIVPGTSYSGDKVMAGLNSGEMILNHMQQQRLFNMLNGGAIASAPQVELKVRGTDLVAVLNNYSARRAHVV